MALATALLLLAAAGASAQSLSDAMNQAVGKAKPDSTRLNLAPPAPAGVVVGEVALGTALAAGAGYAVGLLAEVFCDECDAGEPGGDTPGLLIGVPAGAAAGVWLVGQLAPPPGRTVDTVVGAMAGTAVFAAYSKILEEQSDVARWAGVVLPAALAATGWNRSRIIPEPEVSLNRPPPTGWGYADATLELRVVYLRF